jgi:hypothetical protein
MKFEVVFTIKKAKGCCPPIQEVVNLNCRCGSAIDDSFWRDVRRILAGRDTVHPLVMKWVKGKERLGIRVDVYKTQKRLWRYGKGL